MALAWKPRAYLTRDKNKDVLLRTRFKELIIFLSSFVRSLEPVLVL